MADELFELMTKMYNEFSKRFDKSDSLFDKIETRLDTLEKKQSRIEIILEHDMKNQISAIHDSLQLTNHRLDSLEEKVDMLSGQVERQEFEIKVIKGGKKST